MSDFLRSVTLRNFRRFGEPTKLTFSSGANLLLAPNGTGKSSIIEAIELALTGSVKRLGSNLTPLIRDRQLDAEVSLEFASGAASRILLSREQSDPTWETKALHKVFGDQLERGNVPYLLRLTHLMDQRDSDWPTLAESRDAGELLARLPLGHDVNVARDGLTRARLVAARRFSEAQAHVTNTAARLVTCNELLKGLSELKAEESSNLVPLEIIHFQLKPVCENLGITPPSQRVTSLKQVSAACLEGLDREITMLNRRVAKLQVFESSLLEYLKNRESATVLNSIAAELNPKITGQLLRQETLTAQLVAERKHVAHLDSLIVQILDEEQRSSSKGILEEELYSLEAAADALQSTIEVHELNNIELSSEMERLESLREEHQQLQLMIQSSERTLVELKHCLEQADAWLQGEGKLGTVQQELLEATERLKKSNEKYTDTLQSLTIAKAELDSLKNTLSRLRKSNDKLREAVSQLGEHLPPRATSCPVCSTSFNPGELHERLRESLAESDPGLSIAIDMVRAKELQLSQIQKQLTSDDLAIKERTIACDNARAQTETLIKEIAHYSASAGLHGSKPEECIEKIKSKIRMISREKSNLLRVKSKLAEEPTDSVVTEIRLKTEHSRREWKAVSDRLNNLLGQIVAKQSLLESLKSVASGDFFDPHTELAAVHPEYLQAREQMQQTEKELARCQETLAQLQRDARRNQKTNTSLDRIANELVTEWRSMGLAAEPEINRYRSALTSSEHSLGRLTEERTVTESLRLELAKWERSAQRAQAEARIDEFKGQSSIEVMTQTLVAELEDCKIKESQLAKVHAAVTTLAKELDLTRQTLNSMIKEINPGLSLLLKRIVTSHLVSNTTVEPNLSHQKLHVEPTTLLNGVPTKVSHIASCGCQSPNSQKSPDCRWLIIR